jgi:carbamoylphosphate synthase large subunit
LITNKQHVILLVTSTWWPSPARLAIAMLGHGCKVVALCPKNHPLFFVTGVSRIHTYSHLNSLSDLEKTIREENPDIVVPFDDSVVLQLHHLYAKRPELRALIERSLGDPRYYEIVCSRDGLLRVAGELGLRVPDTKRIESEADLEAWCANHTFPSVVKLDGTWGGSGVRFVHSLPEARKWLKRMKTSFMTVLAGKRLFVDLEPLSLWALRASKEQVVTIQRIIHGRPANTMMACWQGKLLTMVTVEVVWSRGVTGSATVVRIIDNAEITQAARLLVERLNLSGFYGLDFMLQEKTGDAYLLEMNPRCTQLGHLQIANQIDLAGALCSQLTGTPAEPLKNPIYDDTITFFPQAMSWNPKSPFPTMGYHDVPREEPRLVQELMQYAWPHRKLVARIFHRFFPPREWNATCFDPPPVTAERTERIGEPGIGAQRAGEL